MRICSRCGGRLQQGAGYERSAEERGGNPLEVDQFHCVGCGWLYLHSYEERFTGDIEGWAWRERNDQPWQAIPEGSWPTSGS